MGTASPSLDIELSGSRYVCRNSRNVVILFPFTTGMYFDIASGRESVFLMRACPILEVANLQ